MDLGKCCFIDPQAQLKTALANQDIRLFIAVLSSGAQIDPGDYDKILSTPGSQDFIEACAAHGGLFNDNSVIHAASSLDPDNLTALLKFRPDNVDFKDRQLTPLNSLAKILTEENASSVLSCMKLLLDYGASPNIPDDREFTPLGYILSKNKVREHKELVQLFLNQPMLDIDSLRYGEVRQLLQVHFPELPLPEERQRTEMDINRLLKTLRGGDEALFEKQFAEYKELAHQKEEYHDMLKESIKLGRQRAIEIILANGIDFKESDFLGRAIYWGNWKALERLLAEPNFCPHAHLQTNEICALIDLSVESSKHQRCFDVLMASKLVDINMPSSGWRTPLCFAGMTGCTLAMQKLLKRGAYIGSRTHPKSLPIEHIPHDVLEEHFNSCITLNNYGPFNQIFEINIDFRNLLLYGAQDGPISEPYNTRHDEMAPIAFMAKSKELRHLLQHPLISSFLILKWRRLSKIFYLNLLLYSLFTVSIVTNTLLRINDSDHSALITLTTVFSYLGIGYLTIRESIQLFLMSGFRYFWSITNMMECFLILMSTCTWLEFNDKETQRVLAAFTILFVSIEFCLLMGSLPVLSISTHMLMLRQVSITFLKSFGLYSIFVLTFSICFHILFPTPPVQDNVDPLKEGKEEFDFAKPIVALTKTIAMMTGELNAGDLEFTSISSYLIFLFFVLFMTIVLVNLLNGLAVSDTQTIRAQAELNAAIVRTNVLCRYELNETDYVIDELLKSNYRILRIVGQMLRNIVPRYQIPRQVSIFPNMDNSDSGNDMAEVLMANVIHLRNGGTTGRFKSKRGRRRKWCPSP
ncbi:transient receptor potential cation channel protein painless-like [Drosophila rhopaloa]|uniref:Transient receptor potential cation channel protein painless-like n=1 Tax=Drosophila rhopaloa TaxID=1041015 RepID=A0A6P4EA66_DRORH|nr:transient receptor potential cation channel protein painless-like [Drosophila rhopaloa]XP_016974905.1 transient receptor potential cation channel protein painless-like [Drosophila rhopaloa]